MRKIQKYTAAFMIILIVLVGINVLAISPPRINIDTPVNNSYITNSVKISGWSLDTSGVKSVQVYINGKKAGNAQIGLKRSDVNNAINKSGVYKGALYSGFTLTLNTSSYLPGTYQLKVLSTGVNGTTVSKTITLKKAAPLIHIDSPAAGGNISSDFSVQGWSLNPCGVKEVDVSIDGKTPVSVQTGISRPDVNRVCNSSGCYPGAANSGYKYAVSYKSLTLGSHTIVVTSYGNDGSKVSTSVKVNIILPPPLAQITAPLGKVFMEGSFTVSGWSMNVSGVKSVDVYIGNTKVGSATIGLESDDVNTTYNSDGLYTGGANSGFTFTLPDTSAYPAGNYKVSVISTGNDNTTATASETVTKLPARLTVDAPTNNSTVTGDFVLRGWAVTPGGASSVQVLVDGKLFGTATLGGSRPDVQNSLSKSNGGDGYNDSASSGFSYSVDLDTVQNGAHKITAIVTGTTDGATATVSENITVNKPSPIAMIETPNTNNEYLKDTLTVTGWSVNASNVKNVEVYLDGNDLGSATIGLSRPDVNSKVNSGNIFKGAANCGYTLTATGLDNYAAGSHTVKIVSTGNDGSTAVYQTQVTKAAPVSKFDTATKNMTVNNSNFTVSGWAINATGIKEVDFYYNNTLIDTETTGSSSPDVLVAYDKNNIIYDNSANARYSCTVSIDSVPYGTGTLEMQAVGNDGVTTYVSTTINVVKPAPLGNIDTPVSGQNLTYYDTSIVISGWTLNASGVKTVSVYLDNTQIQGVQTGLTSDSGILALSNGQYKGDANARFTTGSIDITSLSYAQHTIKVVAVGNDGGVYQFTETINKSSIAYSSYSISLSTMLSLQSSSVSNSNINPTTILNQTNVGIYEFMNLQYNANTITATQINSMLTNKGVLNNMGQAFIDAANTYHINPVYLAAHARLETGNGTSTLATGQVYSGDGVKYYNVYGIGAYDGSANSSGLVAAHEYGWNSVYKAIVGGAQFIHDHYVYAATMGHPPTQNTLYKMRWDPDDASSGNALYQYATDPNWAYNIAVIISENADIFDGYQLTFDIPQYKQ